MTAELMKRDLSRFLPTNDQLLTHQPVRGIGIALL
jgi:hypothetical protein